MDEWEHMLSLKNFGKKIPFVNKVIQTQVLQSPNIIEHIGEMVVVSYNLIKSLEFESCECSYVM